MKTLAFDVYGTLIDTQGVTVQLQQMIGDQATEFAKRWREKQLEYSFRRGLMQDYQPFSTCTLQALQHTDQLLGTKLRQAQQEQLMQGYAELPAFAEVPDALLALQQAGYQLLAFSNGQASAVERLLNHAEIRHFFSAVVSVDDVQSFKPDPAVYAHFLAQAASQPSNTWLISGNPFDITGARHAGWHTAWIQRDATLPFDPWAQQPDLTLSDLSQLANQLPAY